MMNFGLSRIMVLFISMSLCSCFKSKNENKKFVFCSEGAPISFNPQLAGDGTSFDASSQAIYNRLVDFKPGTTKVIPSLASSWAVLNGGKTVYFKLRKDVSFHENEVFAPSRNFNADDVVFSFERMLNSSHPYNKVGGGVYEYFQSTGLKDVLRSVKKISDFEVSFELKSPDATFIPNLAMDFASVLSSDYAARLSALGKLEQIDMKPVGTGPFKFVSYKKNKKINYVSHQKYFLGAPQIQKLVFLITPNPKERVAKLKAGRCHLVKEPPPKSLPDLSADSSLRVVKINGLNTGYIGFNLSKPKLQNKKLREAIGLALNRRSYIESVYRGRAEIAHSPLPPDIWGLDAEIKPLDYDLEKAKALIEESGVDTPISLNLWTLPVSRPYNPNGQRLGEMMRDDLRQIGIDLKLSTSSWPGFLEKSKKGEHELIEYGWSSDNGDPDNFLYTLLSCDGAAGKSNVARFCHKEYDKLVTKARAVYSKNERQKLYLKALKIFRNELPWIPIAHANVYRAMSAEVRGYTPRPLGTESFYNLSLVSWSDPDQGGEK